MTSLLDSLGPRGGDAGSNIGITSELTALGIALSEVKETLLASTLVRLLKAHHCESVQGDALMHLGENRLFEMLSGLPGIGVDQLNSAEIEITQINTDLIRIRNGLHGIDGESVRAEASELPGELVAMEHMINAFNRFVSGSSRDLCRGKFATRVSQNRNQTRLAIGVGVGVVATVIGTGIVVAPGVDALTHKREPQEVPNPLLMPAIVEVEPPELAEPDPNPKKVLQEMLLDDDMHGTAVFNRITQEGNFPRIMRLIPTTGFEDVSVPFQLNDDNGFSIEDTFETQIPVDELGPNAPLVVTGRVETLSVFASFYTPYTEKGSNSQLIWTLEPGGEELSSSKRRGHSGKHYFHDALEVTRDFAGHSVRIEAKLNGKKVGEVTVPVVLTSAEGEEGQPQYHEGYAQPLSGGEALVEGVFFDELHKEAGAEIEN